MRACVHAHTLIRAREIYFYYYYYKMCAVICVVICAAICVVTMPESPVFIGISLCRWLCR